MQSPNDRAEQLGQDAPVAQTFGSQDRLLSRFFRTANLLTSSTTSWLEDCDVTSQQWSVLGSLSQPRVDQGVTVTQLSDYLMLSRQHLTVVLDQLDKRGLTKRVPDAYDGRTRRVQLTAKGRRLVAVIIPRLADFYRMALKGFNEAEQKDFMTFVDRLKSNLGNL